MSKATIRIAVGLAGATFLSLVIAVGVAIAEDAQPKPVAGISNIMVAVNDDKTGLFGTIKDFCAASPGKDQAEKYKLMRHRAQIVAECANVLMAKSPPRGADDAAGVTKWRQHCANFRDAAKKLSRALAMKKADKAGEAIKNVEAQCEACHNDHKSK